MILRFAPSRFLVFSAVLATSLALVPPPLTFGQTAKDMQETTPYPGSVVEDIVARVNDQVISTSDYDRAVQDLEQQAQQHQWTEQQLFEQKHNMLRDLIDQQLLISRGKQLDITGETELVKELDEMRKQYHLDTMDDLQKAAEAQGVSWQDFKANMRNHIISQEVIRQEVSPHINISSSEVQAYYDAHKQDFAQPEQVQLSEIMIPTANPDDAAQVDQAKKKADDAEAKLKSGTDFAALAKTASGGMTAANGGNMGDFKRGQLAKVIEDQTFDLKAGQFTEPIRTKQGYVIFEVTQHIPGGIPTLKEVEPQIENQIGMTKMDPALRDYMTKLRENAYIDIKNGYEDSGASPNEMKPIYSAYTPPTRKKKKHVNRTRFNGRGRNAHVETVAETSDTSPTKREAKVKNGTMKPGKREKVRFGQAPRETLPAAAAKTEEGSESSIGTQVAANDASAVPATPAQTDASANADQPEVKQKRTRFANRAKEPKSKRQKKGPKVDPFAPPPETKQELATQQQQSHALGLNGDTSKKKKKNPRKEGPKRRMSDEKKESGAQPSSTQPATPTPTPAPATGSSQQ